MENTVGIIGLGQMGLSICCRVATSFEVLAYDISEERRELAKLSANVRTTEQIEAISDCSIVLLSLPNPAVSKKVIGTLGPKMSPGSIIIETSTVLPSDIREWAALLGSYNIHVLDAAVLSGVQQMTEGRATLLLGGDAGDIQQVSHLLDTLGGAGCKRLGPLGSGMAAKVVNNSVAHAVMVVLVEAFALAKSEDVDLASIAEILARPDGGLSRPLTHRIMERVAVGKYEGGMPLEAARKDSTLAIAMAQNSSLPLFAIQSAQTVYELALTENPGSDDYSCLARLWEKWGDDSLQFTPT